jgi:hypothetical protein
MKAKNNSQGSSITEPLLAHIKERDQANFEANFPNPSVGSTPLAQPDLYQDSGGGYNANFTYPQD